VFRFEKAGYLIENIINTQEAVINIHHGSADLLKLPYQASLIRPGFVSHPAADEFPDIGKMMLQGIELKGLGYEEL
jgi:hypothetical protein